MAIVLDKNTKIFVVHIATLSTALKIQVYFSCQI